MDDELQPPLDPELLAYICVDVETAGSIPSEYPLLSIGACSIPQPRRTFYIELKPDKAAYTREALDVSKLSLDELAERGVPPADAMQRFEDWILETAPPGIKPIFVAFNAPFDWMFINDYFERYLGRNPFGHSALDIKAFYMGISGVSWDKTSMREVIHHFSGQSLLTHHALQDALDQADLFQKMLNYSNRSD